MNTVNQDGAVAVIGMAGRFPGAANVREFWKNLCEGRESIRFFSQEELLQAGTPREVLQRNEFVPAYGTMDDADGFDASFFGYAPREAEMIDPQQRVLLETAWLALEDAGYEPDRLRGRGSIFATCGVCHYLLELYPHRAQLENMGIEAASLLIAADRDALATRIAHKLNLTGAALTVQTACSGSLVAIHLACQNLLLGESDVALAGGVSVRLPQARGYLYTQGNIYSPDGHCRPFDVNAEGTVFGSGAGMVVLKRLKDAIADNDFIYAVIAGSAVNNDGSEKVGFTAPAVSGQAAAIAEAMSIAGIGADDIQYVETHGTATALGDAIEIAALAKAYEGRETNAPPCPIGAVKSNIGHLEVAAGIAGFIKTVLILQHREIPPTLHFEAENPKLGLSKNGFYVPTSRTRLGGEHPRAAVSSFGFGGTNAHAILEAAPDRTRPGTTQDAPVLLCFSGRSPDAALLQAKNVGEALGQSPGLSLVDVAHTLRNGRRAFEWRTALACAATAEAIEQLKKISETTDPVEAQPAGTYRVVFGYSGQGAQHAAMSQEVYEREPVFRRVADQCLRLFAERGVALTGRLFNRDWKPDTAEIHDTLFAQCALFTIQVAMTELWRSFGLAPSGVVGHSVGELAAAWAADVLSLEDAVTLTVARARAVAELPPGSMLAVALSEHELGARSLPKDVALAAINGVASCVVSGPSEAIAALSERWTLEDIANRRLGVSHAFHSSMMTPALEPVRRAAEMCTRRQPRIGYLSPLTGKWLDPATVTSAAYWPDAMRQTVRFHQALETLFSGPRTLLVEVGPSQPLTSMALAHPRSAEGHRIIASSPRAESGESDLVHLLSTLGTIWSLGFNVGRGAANSGRSVPLPGYPFERKRFFIDVAGLPMPRLQPAALPSAHAAPEPVVTPPSAGEAAPAQQPQASGSYTAKRYAVRGEKDAYEPPRTDTEKFIVDVFQTVLGIDNLGIRENFFRIGGNSLVALQVITRIRRAYSVRVPVRRFFDGPTPGEIAAYVDGERKQQEEVVAS